MKEPGRILLRGRSKRLCHGLLVCLLLTILFGCAGESFLAAPVAVEPTLTPRPARPTASVVEAATTPTGAVAATPTAEPTSRPARTRRPRRTREPTLTPRPSPTVEPTLTPQPTVTVVRSEGEDPVVTIAEPTASMFLPSPVDVEGQVANVTSGQIRLRVQTPDGQPLGLEPAMAETEVVDGGLRFRGTLPLELAPTPRGLVLVAEYLDDDGEVRAVAEQPVNAIGRFARVQYIVVENPLPFTQVGDEEITVRGVAPGPPSSMVVRLLDDQEQVLQSVPATLSWLQTGQPCSFTALLPNAPGGASIQVLSLGDDDTVLEQARVRLGQPAP